MSKLKFNTAIIVMFFCATMFSQNDRYIYFHDLDSEAIEYSNDGDYKLTTFSIYYEGYETKKKRDSTKQAQIIEREKNRCNLGYNIPPSGINFVSTDPPEKLSSLQGITTISPKEYREGKYRGVKFKHTYIITPCQEGGYYKWRVNSLPNI